MAQFPTVFALGSAPIEQVIKAWEGLGYYSRARNIHAAAKILIEKHGGELPNSKEALLALPGLGPYTAGAILSFGFRQRAVAVDGNVARVVARFAWIDEEISRSSAKQKLEKATENLLSQEKPWVSMEALIELGATLCSATPLCHACPLQKHCVAHRKEMATALPIKSAPPKVEKISRGVAIVEAEGRVLVRKNQEDQLMGDLWEFPYFEEMTSLMGVKKKLVGLLGEAPVLIQKLGVVEHSFTRFSAKLFPFRFLIPECKPVDGFCWVAKDKLQELPFSSGHRKLVKLLYI
jgi:A/G-specific adenine glycosylase